MGSLGPPLMPNSAQIEGQGGTQPPAGGRKGPRGPLQRTPGMSYRSLMHPHDAPNLTSPAFHGIILALS